MIRTPAGAERVQYGPSDETARRRTAAGRDHQKIRVFGQLLEIRLEAVSGALDRITVAIGDLHTEPLCPARHGTAHVAKAKNAQPLAAHLCSQRQVFMQPTS